MGSRELAWFAVLALGATAVLHVPLIWLGFSLSPGSPSLYLYLAGLATPSLAAIALAGAGRREFLRNALTPRGSASVYACAVLAQSGVLALAWLLLVASSASARPRLALAPEFAVLAAGQLWVAFGEELGWRGFALPRLEALHSPRVATLVLAVLWGVWHAPMFFVADSLQAGASPYVFAASIFAWSAIHTALYQRAGPSAVPNLVFHACANVTLNLGLLASELAAYLFAAYLCVGAAVLASLRRRDPAGH